MNNSELAGELRQSLARHEYSDIEETISFDGVDGLVLGTPRRMMVRHLCVLTDLPDDWTKPSQVEVQSELIRKELTKRYARMPYWKELGTMLVFLVGSELYDAVGESGLRLKDMTGLHCNIRLGTVLIDKEQFRHSGESTWGLIFSGPHFATINEVADSWCQKMRPRETSAV